MPSCYHNIPSDSLTGAADLVSSYPLFLVTVEGIDFSRVSRLSSLSFKHSAPLRRDCSTDCALSPFFIVFLILNPPFSIVFQPPYAVFRNPSSFSLWHALLHATLTSFGTLPSNQSPFISSRASASFFSIVTASPPAVPSATPSNPINPLFFSSFSFLFFPSPPFLRLRPCQPQYHPLLIFP